MSKMKRLEIEVFGDVQGVSFRYVAKSIAKKLGVFGWIRNETNSSIRIVIEGDSEKVQEFLDWCHHGSPMATVEKVESREGEYTGEYKDFEVR